MPLFTTQPRPAPSPVLAAARHYARSGWPVFPVNSRKIAKLSEKKTGRRWGASNDLGIVEQMFRQFPDADVAIETGASSGIIVIDLDNKNGKNGTADWEALLRQHVDAALWTAEAASPNSGSHLYFRHPGRHVYTTNSRLAPGIDVKGDDGSVVAPPSRGRKWCVPPSKIKRCPTWLADLICEDRPRHPARGIPSQRPADRPHKPQVPVDPEMQRALMQDAGRGVSLAAEDLLVPDDVDLKMWCALRVIPADIGYLDWFRIGAAIHQELGEQGFEHFREWSAEGQKYDERECEAKWRDCSRAKRSGGAPTVYYIADQYDRSWRDAYRVMLMGEKIS